VDVVVGVAVEVLAAVVVVLPAVVLAVPVLAVVAVVDATGVKVPAVVRLFGEVEDALCAFASWVTAAMIACAAVWVVAAVVDPVVAWVTGVVVDEVVPELAEVVLADAVDGVVLVVVTVVVVVVLEVGVLEDETPKSGTMEIEKVCPLTVVVLITGVPVATVSVLLPSNSE